ncbi:hypothetical protein AB4307_05025 [Vibrio sp. 10N.261.52.C2]|uniref:hypothetical protein n=1 Tax=Vibrio sp. 10N.261.52.C2 TaxID=3229681 RepID=UPI0035529DBD
MSNLDPIEFDEYYKRLSGLVSLSGLNRVEQVLFLSVFESWYYFQSYEVYSSISCKAIEVFEEIDFA